MNEQKSLFRHIAETIDRYRAEQRAAPAEGASPQSRPPGRLRRFLHWLTPNGGTLLLIAALLLTAQVWAKPLTSPANAPGPSATTVNYQGRLADSGGSPLDGSYGMTFALYDAASDGSLVWGPEGHTAVPVSDGLFSVGMGSQTSGGIPTSTWNGDRYLEITVGGETLSPRELIRSVPVAGMALTVPDGAITLEKLGLGKYTFWLDNESSINYRGPTGQLTTLDLSTCSPEEWCCNAQDTICYQPRSNHDSILEFSLAGAPSPSCLLLHKDDDHSYNSKGLYYATEDDPCHMGQQCARLSREGKSESPIEVWSQYEWLCGW